MNAPMCAPSFSPSGHQAAASTVSIIEFVLRLMTTGSVFVGAVAIYITLLNNRRQLNAQIFLTYSDRLQTIRRSMRADFMAARTSATFYGNEEVEIPAGTLETVHLVFELFILREERYVGNKIWTIWCRDIDRLLNAPIVRQGHQQLRTEFEGHPQFIAWVETRQTHTEVNPGH